MFNPKFLGVGGGVEGHARQVHNSRGNNLEGKVSIDFLLLGNLPTLLAYQLMQDDAREVVGGRTEYRSLLWLHAITCRLDFPFLPFSFLSIRAFALRSYASRLHLPFRGLLGVGALCCGWVVVVLLLSAQLASSSALPQLLLGWGVVLLSFLHAGFVPCYSFEISLASFQRRIECRYLFLQLVQTTDKKLMCILWEVIKKRAND